MYDEAEFHQTLIQFPSSFSLEIEELNKSKHVESHKKKLELKCETNEFETTAEWIRVYNLLSFLHWKAEDTDNAYEHNTKALDLEKDNIVALCNRVWMQWKDGHWTEADEELNHVKQLAESRQDLLLQGKAEIAYSYSAFGPRYFSHSINMYNQLLLEIVDKDIDAKLVQLWKLNLGLTYRKFCNCGNALPKQDWRERNMDDCIEKAALIFNEIVTSDSPSRWKGRCYASLAELAFSICTNIHGAKSQKDLFPKEIANNNVETFLNLALGACDKDSHVLRVCGKLFKYLKQLDKAEEILRKSLSIMETSYGHHHLAMVLKKKLMNRIRYGLHKTDKRRSTDSVIEVKLAPPSLDGEYSLQSQTTTPHPSFTRLESHSIKILKKEAAKAYSSVINIPADESDAVKEIMSHLEKAIGFGNEWASFEKA